MTDGCSSADSDTATITVESVATLDCLYFVPAAAKAAGAAESFFLTDVTVNNAGNETATYAFWWLPRGGDNLAPSASATFTLAAGRSVVYTDVLGAAFGREDGALGALALASDREDLLLMSRTYNQVAETGATFGLAIPGFPTGDLITAGSEPVSLTWCSNDPMSITMGGAPP